MALLVDSVLVDAGLADPLLSLVLFVSLPFVSLLSVLRSESLLPAALFFALPLRP